MDSDKWFCNTGSECHTLDKAFIKAYNGEIYPATPKQRNLLFKKMHEVGYEWNVEKKELIKITDKSAEKIELDKKFTPIESALKDLICDVDNSYTIEQVRRFLFEYGYNDKILNAAQEEMQKPADKIEQKPDKWEPQTGDIFRKKGTTSPTYHLCDKLEDGITFGFVENREVGIAGGEITIFVLRQDYELVERLKSIEDVVEEELNRALQTKVEHKSVWSEQDEKHLSWLIEHLNQSGELYRNLIDWLKSLKSRVQPQPKQECGDTEIAPPIDSDVCG
jgi:hypothetical protein